MTPAQRKFRSGLLLAIGVLVVAGISWAVMRVARVLDDLKGAENRLHATILAKQLTGDFVAQHGDWPRSWDDLASVAKPKQGQDRYGWWKDASPLEAQVEIDFGITLESLRDTTEETFSAVRPAGRPVYHGYETGWLLETCKKALEAKHPAAEPPPGK